MNELWRDFVACVRFVFDWLEYTPSFFRNVRRSEWCGYFGSCFRVCCMLAITREHLRED